MKAMRHSGCTRTIQCGEVANVTDSVGSSMPASSAGAATGSASVTAAGETPAGGSTAASIGTATPDSR